MRPHTIHVSLSHVAPAYVGEEYPIQVEVTNADSKELDVVADALLQPTEIEGASESSCFVTPQSFADFVDLQPRALATTRRRGQTSSRVSLSES